MLQQKMMKVAVSQPLQRGRKIHGVEKIGDFRLKSPFISEIAPDMPIIAMER